MTTASTSAAPAATQTLSVTDARVECAECGYKSHALVSHLMEAHGLTVADYLSAHAGAATVSDEALKMLKTAAVRRGAPAPTGLTANLMGIQIPVDGAVPANASAPVVGRFRTLAAPDTDPPQIQVGPYVEGITQESAVVR